MTLHATPTFLTDIIGGLSGRGWQRTGIGQTGV
jgi:hypothetical protein